MNCDQRNALEEYKLNAGRIYKNKIQKGKKGDGPFLTCDVV